MPSEKKRVIWSAPTKSCQCRSASSRRNIRGRPPGEARSTNPRKTDRPLAGAPQCRSLRARRRRRSGPGSRRARSATRSAPEAPAPSERRGPPAAARSRRGSARSWIAQDGRRCRRAHLADRDHLTGRGVLADGLGLVESSVDQHPTDVGQDLGLIRGVGGHPVDDHLQGEALSRTRSSTAHGTRSA